MEQLPLCRRMALAALCELIKKLPGFAIARDSSGLDEPLMFIIGIDWGRPGQTKSFSRDGVLVVRTKHNLCFELRLGTETIVAVVKLVADDANWIDGDPFLNVWKGRITLLDAARTRLLIARVYANERLERDHHHPPKLKNVIGRRGWLESLGEGEWWSEQQIRASM